MPTIKASDFNGDLSDFLKDYKYQQKLTPKLDDLEGVKLSPELVNEIVLWKVNRYVSLDVDQLHRLDTVATLKPGEHRKALAILEELLGVPGVDLPMASTFLRFRNPSVFQIIDGHAYRAVYGEKYPFRPSGSKKTFGDKNKKIVAYFDYLDKLIELCNRKTLTFGTVDRLLYKFDKQENDKLKGTEPDT
jgi:hypothetical protein